jgi:hypothetical protein
MPQSFNCAEAMIISGSYSLAAKGIVSHFRSAPTPWKYSPSQPGSAMYSGTGCELS